MTSCPFADAVRDSYMSGPVSDYRVIQAYSPITGSTYTMTCTRKGAYIECLGGDNAVVYIY